MLEMSINFNFLKFQQWNIIKLVCHKGRLLSFFSKCQHVEKHKVQINEKSKVCNSNVNRLPRIESFNILKIYSV
jgi:hypothetical protein